MSEEILLIDKTNGKLEITVEKGDTDEVFMTIYGPPLLPPTHLAGCMNRRRRQTTMHLNPTDCQAIIAALSKVIVN